MPAIAPITDYASLLAALAAYLARDDLQDFAPLFVQAAEGRFNTDLRVPEMQAQVAPVAVTDAGTTLPADFLDWVAVRWAPPAGSVQRPLFLTYREPDSPEVRARHRPNGAPQFYTVLAKTVRVVPAAAGAIELYYYQRIPALSATAPSNWLIARAPEVYLYGTLAEAMLFQKDEKRAADWVALMKGRLTALFGQSDTQKVAARSGRAANDAAEASAKITATG